MCHFRSLSSIPRLLVLAIALTACDQRSSFTPTALDLRAMKNGNGGGGGNGIKVRSVDPDTAFQGQSLNIEVKGSGFDTESEVSFEVGGQPANDIAVQATQFVNERKLIASISVADDAQLIKYDVAVESLSRGKKGIGLELFEVKQVGPPFEDPLSVVIPSGFDVTEDGDGTYIHETGEVQTRIFGSGNFGLDVRGSKKGRNKSDRRVCVMIRSADGGTTLFPQAGQNGCLDLGATTSDPDRVDGFRDVADGESMTTRMRFLWANESGADEWIRYGSKCEWSEAGGWTPDPASRATVTGVPNGWTVEAEPAFWCVNNPTNVMPHPSAGDPEGRVLVSLRFEAQKLFP